MSALLIEILEDTIPSQLPLTQTFDKTLIIVPDSAPKLMELFNSYTKVTTCSGFIRSESKLNILQTSSEFVRGAVTATLSTAYKLSVCTSRASMLQSLLPSVPRLPLQTQADNSSQSIDHQLQTKADNSTPSIELPPQIEVGNSAPSIDHIPNTLEPSSQISSTAHQEIPAYIQKLCNAYLSSCVSSPRVRANSVTQAKAQILSLVQGEILKYVPAVSSVTHAVEEIFSLMMQLGYFVVKDDKLIYNDDYCSNQVDNMPELTLSGKLTRNFPKKPKKRLQVIQKFSGSGKFSMTHGETSCNDYELPSSKKSDAFERIPYKGSEDFERYYKHPSKETPNSTFKQLSRRDKENFCFEAAPSKKCKDFSVQTEWQHLSEEQHSPFKQFENSLKQDDPWHDVMPTELEYSQESTASEISAAPYEPECFETTGEHLQGHIANIIEIALSRGAVGSSSAVHACLKEYEQTEFVFFPSNQRALIFEIVQEYLSGSKELCPP